MNTITDLLIEEQLAKANNIWPHADEGQQAILIEDVCNWLSQMVKSDDPQRPCFPINPVELRKRFPNLGPAIATWRERQSVKQKPADLPESHPSPAKGWGVVFW